jgi:hypothetical protein
MKHKNPRTAEHRKKLSEAHKGKIYLNRRNAFKAHCVDCGKYLPGIRLSRIKKNPDRVCWACHLTRQPKKTIRKDGYVIVKTGVNKQELEHRVIMEKKLGRRLTRKEIVHHDNEIRNDNEPDNLVLCASAGLHRKLYHAG